MRPAPTDRLCVDNQLLTIRLTLTGSCCFQDPSIIMPPTRTAKKNVAPINGPLGRFGFTTVTQSQNKTSPTSSAEPWDIPRETEAPPGTQGNSSRVDDGWNAAMQQLREMIASQAKSLTRSLPGPEAASARYPYVSDKQPVAQPNISTPQPPPVAAPAHTPTRSILPPIIKVGKGVKKASFFSQLIWDCDYRHQIGTSTREIEFGSSFALTA